MTQRQNATRDVGARAASRLLLLLVTALGTVVDPGPTEAQQAPVDEGRSPALETRTSTLEARIEAFRADLESLRGRLGIPGLSVAVGQGGELLWAEGLGLADVATETPATADTPYRIASITKTMTAAVVVGLAEEGALALEDPVARWLDDAPAWAAEATVRHLLSHTSESEPPGTGFAYSGRYDLLARVAETAAGRPFPDLLVERVMEPAGMTRSYPVSLDTAARADGVREALATPHLPDGEPAPEGIIRDHTVGGNGVVSTAPDLVRWAQGVAAGQAVAPGVRERMWTPTVTSEGDTLPYGLGWWVEETPAVSLVSHGGQWPVYSGLLLHVRDRRSGDRGWTLAILANHTNVSSPFYTIGTGTALYSTFAASFLRRFALDRVWGGAPPELPRDASADSLASVVRGYGDPAARLHLGAELFGLGLVARRTGRPERADSLLRAAAECCPAALAASEPLGLLFHLGRSQDPELRERGQRAGYRRLERYPGDPTTRFHLAVSHVQAGEEEEAEPLLRGLVERRGDVPTWMWSWSAYLLAETIADERPERARDLLERVLADGQDVDGLFGEVRSLLDALEGGSGRDP